MRLIEPRLFKFLIFGVAGIMVSSIACAASKCPQYKTIAECMAKCSAGADACAAYLGMECGKYCQQALPEPKGSIDVSVRNTQTVGTDLMVPIVIKGPNGYRNKISTAGTFVDLAPGEYPVYVDSALFSATPSKSLPTAKPMSSF